MPSLPAHTDTDTASNVSGLPALSTVSGAPCSSRRAPSPEAQEDEYDIGDSVSALQAPPANISDGDLQEKMRDLMAEQLKELQLTWQQKQEEMMGMISSLQAKNATLESQVAESRQSGSSVAHSVAASATPVAQRRLQRTPSPSGGRTQQASDAAEAFNQNERRRSRSQGRPSLIELDERPSPTGMTPSRSTEARKMRMSTASRSGSRYSMIDLSTGGSRRMSMTHSMTEGSGGIQKERKWMAWQRTNLMDELYPDGNGIPAPAGGNRRASLAPFLPKGDKAPNRRMSMPPQAADSEAEVAPRALAPELDRMAPQSGVPEAKKQQGSKLRQPKASNWRK